MGRGGMFGTRRVFGWRRVLGSEGPRGGAEIIIEIKEHGRTLGGGLEQVAKFSQGMRADRVAFIGGQQPEVEVFVGENIKMVEPEIGELLLELALAVDGPQ